jgi:(2Fe-2S) ferredoxin
MMVVSEDRRARKVRAARRVWKASVTRDDVRRLVASLALAE